MKYFLFGKNTPSGVRKHSHSTPKATSVFYIMCVIVLSSNTDVHGVGIAYHTASTSNKNITLLALNASFQEQVTITGTVRDESGAPLPEATVQVKGNPGLVTKTNGDGQFSFRVPVGSTIQVTFLGYSTAEIAVRNQGPYTINLQPDASELEEVLVVGYSTQSKKEFTGAASRIVADQVKEIPVQSFDQALIGRASGVKINLPNGVLNNAPVIRIRGTNSISLSSYPLIVIDGIPVTSGDVSSNTTVANNPLADINPSDIESIDVLKDAASTAIYGSRAANGVVLVTTKRGKEGSARVTYDGWVGFTDPVRLPELLEAEDFMMIKNEAQLNRKILSGQADNDDVASALFFPSYNADGSMVNTNWYDYMFQTGVQHSHAVSVSGGSPKTRYFFSANLTEQDGFLQTNEFDRTGLRFNLDHDANSWLKLRGSISYTKSENRAPNSGSMEGNAQLIVGAARMAYTLNPNVPAYNPDGTPHLAETPGGPIGNGANQIVSVYYNPVALFELVKNSSTNDRILANVGATINLLKGLNFTTSYSLDRLTTLNVGSTSPVHGSGSTTNGSVTNVTSLFNNWNFTNTLNYDARFADHHISVVGGMDVQDFSRNRWGVNVQQASDPFFTDIQGNWGQVSQSGNLLVNWAFLSYFASLNYDYKSRYFIKFNFRRDGNSALGASTKWGNFGGASAGWTLSEEDFYQGSGLSAVMSSVKLRGGWGRVGNGELNSRYGSLVLFSSSLYGGASTWQLNQAGNPNLGWETSEQTNIGADLGFWNDRILVDFSWFNNDVNGLILDVPQSPSKGIPGNSILGNVGSLYNRGIELGISGDVIRKGKFSWNASFNFTSIKNEVTALEGENSRMVSSSSGNPFNMTEAGYSVGTLYGAITNGINPETGQRIYINAAGEQVQYSAAFPSGGSAWTYLDGSPAPAITAADYQPMGNALPKWYGGFNNTFRYGNFDAGINFSFSGGNYVFNGNTGTWLDQRYFNNSVKVLNRWQQPGDVTDVPRLVFNDNFASANIPNISDYVEKGDLLRLQNVLIGYRLPSQLLAKVGVSSLRIYAQATNVYLFTNYTGVEPESSINGNNPRSPGIEYNSLGNGRTFTFGVNIGI
ncbi:SusC/RagA family TonB-linked outer membrane protein [Parapedobacter koreensis]|uniref:TonB-linked outer membrane protein, SusC/RagA family n=1 Tax=Parapedobacter koreensis TaxID=332977 RepID=A0A1H7RR53_9SPHI|nr:TonB-dependent receptor [Parapedobacter koreensis]SEL62701.1 TonB-linked outer membrane protein, SusC/RagA family [Parapedobacter koreensis]